MADGHDMACGRDSEAQRGAEGEVADADRERAKALVPDHQSWCQVVSHLHCCAEGPDDCDCGITESRRGVATALAEERAKARAPFLALADEYDDGRLWSSQVVDRIRAIAEETS